MKLDSDSQQTFDSEQTELSRKRHKSLRVSVTLLRKQLSKAKCKNNE